MTVQPREGMGRGQLLEKDPPGAVCGLGGAGSQGDMEVEGLISPGQFSCRTGHVGGWLTQAKWRLSVDCHRGVPNKGTKTTVPLALAPVPHNSVFPCMILVPPKLLSLHWHPG